MSQQQQLRGRSRPGKTPALTGRRANIGLGGLFGGGGGVEGGPQMTNEQDPATIQDSPPDAEGNSISTQSLTGGPARMQYQPYTVAHPILNFLSGGKASTEAAQMNERMQMQQIAAQDASDHLIQSEQLRERGDQKQADIESAKAKDSALFNQNLQQRTQQDNWMQRGQGILKLPNANDILQQEGHTSQDDPMEIGRDAETLYGKTMDTMGLNQAQNSSKGASSISDLIPALSRSGAMKGIQENTLGADEAGAKSSHIEQNPTEVSDSLSAENAKQGIQNKETQARTDLMNIRQNTTPTKPTFTHIGKYGENGNMFMGEDSKGNPQIHIIEPQYPIDPSTGQPNMLSTPTIGHRVMDLQTGMIKDYNAQQQQQQQQSTTKQNGSGGGSDWTEDDFNPIGTNINTQIQ